MIPPVERLPGVGRRNIECAEVLASEQCAEARLSNNAACRLGFGGCHGALVDNVVDYGYRRVADDAAKCRLVVGGADGSRVDHFVTAELRLSADAAYRRASADCGNVAAILGKNVVVELSLIHI